MKEFLEWLLNHENDIADSVNDFGELQDIFKTLHGREANND